MGVSLPLVVTNAGREVKDLASLRLLPSPYGLETATLALLKLSLRTTKQSESPFPINKEDWLA